MVGLPSARRPSLPESLPASGNSGRARRRFVEDCHRRGIHRRFAGRLRPPFACAPPIITRTWRASVRKSETLDTEALLAHLNTVGYISADVVEMPGEYALRGGILDVYSPEADRPVRIEFFGDEVESIRKFDPGYAAFVERSR